MSEPAILVFARRPLPGTTKTRLIPALGELGAARLYAQLLARTLNEVTAVPRVARHLYAAEADALAYFQARVAHRGWQVEVQSGDTLGARMGEALDRALARHRRAVLIGSDIVDFTAAMLVEALAALQGGSDAVIGPAADGGYWLIGLNRPCAALFDGIAWGTAGVYRATVTTLVAAGLRWHALPVCHDIDAPDDLRGCAAPLAALSARAQLVAGEFRAELFDPAELGAAQVEEPRA